MKSVMVANPVTSGPNYAWFALRSNLYLDGSTVLDNDGSSQYDTRKCNSIPLSAGLHGLYIEGWSNSDVLSSLTTYSGPDTLNKTSVIQAVSNPRAPSLSGPVFQECDSTEEIAGLNNFTICLFKGRYNIDLQSVDEIEKYYKNVSDLFPEFWRKRSFKNMSHGICSGLQGSITFVGRATLPSIKVKRNQFQFIVQGLPNHQFGYIVYGNVNISDSGPYSICSRSADGRVSPPFT